MGTYNVDKERSARKPKNIRTGAPSDDLETKEKYKNAPKTESDWIENDEKQGVPEKTSMEDRERIRAQRLKKVVNEKEKSAREANNWMRKTYGE